MIPKLERGSEHDAYRCRLIEAFSQGLRRSCALSMVLRRRNSPSCFPGVRVVAQITNGGKASSSELLRYAHSHLKLPS